jgi:hypothetical protein
MQLFGFAFKLNKHLKSLKSGLQGHFFKTIKCIAISYLMIEYTINISSKAQGKQNCFFSQRCLQLAHLPLHFTSLLVPGILTVGGILHSFPNWVRVMAESICKSDQLKIISRK